MTSAQPASRRQRARRGGLVTRDFDGIYRHPARRQRSRRFLVLARPGAGPRTRWGVSIKARLGHAVVRNRIRRRVREIVRRTAAPLPAGWDIVIQPRTAEVATAEFAGVKRELEELLAAALGAGTKS